jgi:photosystem II stability/assembly factor-like uncharacterized protein
MKILIFTISIMLSTAVYADWQSLGPTGGYLHAMARSPSSELVIYAAAFITPSQTVRSTDGGNSWERRGSIPDYVYSLAVDPGDPDIVYAGGHSKIYKSLNGGASWDSYAVSNYPIYDIAIHASQPSIISAAGAVKVGAYYYMSYFKSTNSGLNWNTVQLITTRKSCGYCLAIDPSDPNTIFIGGSVLDSIRNPFVFISTNGGTDFMDVSSGFDPCSAASAIAFHPTDPAIVYFGTDAGIYRSPDSGGSWTRVSANGNVSSLGTCLTQPDIVLAGADTTAYKSTDAGASWFQPGSGFYGKDIHNIAVSQTAATDICAANNVGFFKTTTGGSSWEVSNNGMNINAIQNFTLAPSDPTIIYMEVYEVGEFKTTDAGVSWILLPDFLSCGNICAFAVHNTDPEYVLALVGKG